MPATVNVAVPLVWAFLEAIVATPLEVPLEPVTTDPVPATMPLQAPETTAPGTLPPFASSTTTAVEACTPPLTVGARQKHPQTPSCGSERRAHLPALHDLSPYVRTALLLQAKLCIVQFCQTEQAFKGGSGCTGNVKPTDIAARSCSLGRSSVGRACCHSPSH